MDRKRVLLEELHKRANGATCVRVSQRELACALGWSQGTVHHCLHELRAEGLLEWEVDEARRGTVFHLEVINHRNSHGNGVIGLRSVVINHKESPLLGRTPERRKLLEYIQKGESVFIVGSEGCGKSELLRELYSSCDPKRALFIVHGSPTKDFLVSLALELARHGDLDEEPQPDRFERMRNAKLARLCFEALRGKKYTLFIDNADRMNATQQALMEPIVYENQVVMAASKLKPLRWPHFQVVELKPLDEQTMYAIVDLYLDDHGIACENRPLVRRCLVRMASGNLKRLMGALERCRLEGYVTNDFLFEELGAKPEEREYFDVTPIILIGAAIFIGIRFFGLGLGDREIYMFAGMGYAFAWVLRAFMWRWRKPRARSAS